MFEQFKDIRSRYNEKINQLEVDRIDLKARRSALETQYENMIAELASGDDLHDIEDELQQLDSRLAQIDKAVALTKRGRSQKLLEMIPGVKAHREREKERIQQEFDEQLRGVMKQKAEYLMQLRKLAEINAEAVQLNADVAALKNEAGDDSQEFLTAPLSRVPIDESWAYVGTEKASKALSIQKWLIEAAMQGNFPTWATEITQKKGGKK